MGPRDSNRVNTKTLVRKRNDLFAELLKRKLVGNAVEIGVAEGGFSFYLLDCWPGICYQVDPWAALSITEYQDGCNVEQVEQERRFQLVCETAKKYNGRAIPIRGFSADVAIGFADSFFDFVYIDANHKLEYIKEDLKVWYPKCKSGGIFAGHDYLDGVVKGSDYGVKTAVTEFATEHSLSINVTLEKDYPSWWIVKP
jgi:hypothetical protein